eukprot:jgi/Mesvir1/5364/Mv15447-RA.1
MCRTWHRAAFFALALALCLGCGCARELTQSRHEWQIGHFPDPNRDVDRCGRHGQKSWICDPDGLLSIDAANVVESIIQDVAYGAYPFTRKACGPDGVMRGYQIGVALMNKISVKPKASHSPVKGHGSWETQVAPPVPGDADLRVMAQKFAMATFNSWGVGDPECNNGVLLLVSRQDRVVYIATGRGASTSLPESSISLVIGRMKPELRAGNYDLAVQGAVRDIGELLAGDPHGRMREGVLGPEPVPVINETPDRIEYLTVTFFLSSFAIIIGWQWRRERDYQRCLILLSQLDRDAADARAGAYRARVCPICLETYPQVAPGTRLLTCGHRFCAPCIDVWVGKASPFRRFIRRTPLCPVCQQPITAPPGIEGGLDAQHAAQSRGGAHNGSGGDARGGGQHRDGDGGKGKAVAGYGNHGEDDHHNNGHALEDSGGDCRHGDSLPTSSFSVDPAHLPLLPVSCCPAPSPLVPASGLLSWDGFYAEYAFRLARLHARYPAYVTREMLTDATSRQFEGKLAGDARVVLRNPCQEGRGRLPGGPEYPVPGAGDGSHRLTVTEGKLMLADDRGG